MYKKIMVPMDGSKLAESVLPHAEAIAKGCGASEIVLVSVVESSAIDSGWTEYSMALKDVQANDKKNRASAEAYLKKVISQLNYPGITVKAEVIVGKSAAEALADYAKKGVDLIIMSTHGHSGIGRWLLGSVAQRLTQSACVPILLVRSPGCKV